MNSSFANRNRRRSQRGQTLVEYSLVILFVGVATIGVVMSATSHISAFYSSVTSTVSAAKDPTATASTTPNTTLPQ
jgi:Flp pilus assembly pilin Flp